MKKLLTIALKDLKIMFRDPSSLVWMLAMPIALTLAMAFAFGRLTGGGQSAGLSDIPVIIVDLDGGQMSQPIVQTFQSKELGRSHHAPRFHRRSGSAARRLTKIESPRPSSFRRALPRRSSRRPCSKVISRR